MRLRKSKKKGLEELRKEYIKTKRYFFKRKEGIFALIALIASCFLMILSQGVETIATVFFNGYFKLIIKFFITQFIFILSMSFMFTFFVFGLFYLISEKTRVICIAKGRVKRFSLIFLSIFLVLHTIVVYFEVILPQNFPDFIFLPLQLFFILGIVIEVPFTFIGYFKGIDEGVKYFEKRKKQIPHFLLKRSSIIILSLCLIILAFLTLNGFWWLLGLSDRYYFGQFGKRMSLREYYQALGYSVKPYIQYLDFTLSFDIEFLLLVWTVCFVVIQVWIFFYVRKYTLAIRLSLLYFISVVKLLSLYASFLLEMDVGTVRTHLPLDLSIIEIVIPLALPFHLLKAFFDLFSTAFSFIGVLTFFSVIIPKFGRELVAERPPDIRLGDIATTMIKKAKNMTESRLYDPRIHLLFVLGFEVYQVGLSQISSSIGAEVVKSSITVKIAFLVLTFPWVILFIHWHTKERRWFK